MMKEPFHIISGRMEGNRLNSRVLEEHIQKAVGDGHRRIVVHAYGQHGIGGRLWSVGDEKLHIKVTGHPGQRLGSFGYANTFIEVVGPSSDDIGWLNAGAEIVIRGHATNGTANAMAQGKVLVDGNIGARGMTMTKHNPRFDPPELWVLGGVGDYFGEFMAGGIAVVCGFNPQQPENVLGYRPLVGMVGGKVFFRGPHSGYSQADAKLIPIGDTDWEWLTENIAEFLTKIDKIELLKTLTQREQWQLLTARTPFEKRAQQRRSMADFRANVWNEELGEGGLIGDLTKLERSPIPLITTGELRRFVPTWENQKYAPPCEATCPTGIPVHERWRLIREGRVDEAVDLALTYTPFPATVCGYLCPNLCMSECTRQASTLVPVDIQHLGKASVDAGLPEIAPSTGKRVGIVGGGPAGISVAWQLCQNGHEAVVYDMYPTLGGKISTAIPNSRIPVDVISAELDRVAEVIPHVHLQQELKEDDIDRMKEDYDFLIIAVGAQRPRTIPIPGAEKMITALEFLSDAKANKATPGERVVIIGAGNVGCDVATEAHRMGAKDLTLLDVQEPASFGKEREEAEAAGAKFRWPVFTQEITDEGVVLKDGEVIPADTVIISIGDQPNLDFLPKDIETDRGFIKVDEYYQTSDAKIFAIGDAVRPGLLTDAIGAGRKAARTIDNIFAGKGPAIEAKSMIDRSRVSLEYFDPRIQIFEDMDQCGSQCASCGACRDCGVCVAICPETAIRRLEKIGGGYEYVVDENSCIGCGFCAQACPCGVWDLSENSPLV